MPPAAPGEGPRHEARERALALLYEAEMKRLGDRPRSSPPWRSPPTPSPSPWSRASAAHQERIDELMAARRQGLGARAHAGGRPQHPAPGHLRALAEPDVPVAVVIDEAVELAKQYSTEDSGGFVNGVLSTIARQVRA